MWSYFTSQTRSIRSGSHERSLPALQRLCAPGMRPGGSEPELAHEAVGGARVLHLDRGALPGQVRARRRLRDHAVEARALELLEPAGGDRAVERHRREVERRPEARHDSLEGLPALALRRGGEVAP